MIQTIGLIFFVGGIVLAAGAIGWILLNLPPGE